MPTPPSVVQFRVLGTLAISAPGTDAARVCSRPRQVALLAYLTLTKPRGFHRRDTLLGLLWPDADQERARNSLRQALHQIRQALGDDVISARGDQEIALTSDRLRCDAVEFEELADAGRHEDAFARYGGSLLPGFFLDDAPGCEEWLERERARLHDRAIRTLWVLSELAEQRGDSLQAAHRARQAAALDPLSETVVQRLLETLIRSGDRPGAARAFDEYDARVRKELDVEPAPETRALAVAVRNAMAATPLPVAANPLIGPARAATVKRRGWHAPAAAILIASLTVGALVAFRDAPANESAPAIEAVAVLPFAVRGSAELSYLREGLVDLLSAKLEGTRRLRSVDPRAIVTAVRTNGGDSSENVGSRIADRFGARWFVVGDVVEIAGRVRLSASLYEHEGSARAVAMATVEGDIGDLFKLVDDLVGRLLAGIIVGRDSALTNLASLTTQSLPALKAFLDGEREFRAGRDARAVAAFREAIALDTGFALAYYRLAMAVRWSPSSSDGATLAAQATARAHRLPPLAQDLIHGYDAYLKGDIKVAEQLFRRATQSHPDNVDGWFMLGESLFHFGLFVGREMTNSRAAFSRVIDLVGDEPHALLHLGRIAAVDRRHRDLDSLATRFIALNREADRSIEMRALRAFTSGSRAEQVAVANQVLTANDLVLSSVLEAATAYGGNLSAAELLAPAFQAAGRDREFSTWGMRLLTQAALGRGTRRQSAAVAPLFALEPDWELEIHAIFAADAMNRIGPEELTRVRDRVRDWVESRVKEPRAFRYAGNLQPQVRAYLLGLISVRLGDRPAASRYATELTELSRTEVDSSVGVSLAHIVRAEIARSEGNPGEALKELDGYFSAFRLYGAQRIANSLGHARFLRAELLNALGRDGEALQWFASFAGSPDLMNIAHAHRRRAEIHAKRGDRAKAREHYQRFIALWQDCDPDLQPIVTLARRALAEL